jgi:hypothetical protein
MERTKSTDIKIRWKNTGGGNLYLRDKRKILPGETFLAYPREVPMGFRDTIKPLDELGGNKENNMPIIVKPKYTLQKKGPVWYDIVDEKGKKINVKSLKKTDAEEMIKSLEE